MDPDPRPTVLSLCAGIGAMDLGIELAAGTRTVGYVERDSYCQAVLLARMEDESLEPAPLVPTLEGFDGREWAGCVDIVAAGFPCQPYSDAGKRQGAADERAIWPEIARIIGECEPGAVFLENVARSAFRRPLADLQALGFVVHPPCVATSQNFGAPDVRERWFVLATHPAGAGPPQREGERGDAGEERPPAERGGTEPPHAHGHGLTGEWGGWVFDEERQTLRHDADGCSPGCRICGSPWATESPAVRVDAGTPGRVERLRAIGNVGTPPLVYARAFLSLASHAGLISSNSQPAADRRTARNRNSG